MLRQVDKIAKAKEFFDKLNNELCICDERCVMFEECNRNPDICESCTYIFQHIDEWLNIVKAHYTRSNQDE